MERRHGNRLSDALILQKMHSLAANKGNPATTHVFFYLSGAGVDILRPALVPVGQQLDGGRRRAEPQQLRCVLVQEAVIIEQVLVQHGSEEDIEGERRVRRLFTRAEQ